MLASGGCRKRSPLEETGPSDSVANAYNATPYLLTIPEHFPVMTIPADNPLTVEGVTLGRRLFFDSRLSEGGPMAGHACASCHIPQQSFASPGGGSMLSVLPWVNLGWNQFFWLWGGRVSGTLEQVMLFEVRDFFQVDPAVLAQDTQYRRMFRAAFGTEEITQKRIAYALAQFARTLISANSKYDRWVRGEATLTPLEQQGMNIFFSERGDCFHCHTPPLFTDFLMHNIGLDSLPQGDDLGYFLVTGDSHDIGKFRTPTLRNLVFTSPYMHDGRFATLDEVINFYSEGIHRVPQLDPIFAHGGRTTPFTASEKAALKAFLLTLTDSSFVQSGSGRSLFPNPDARPNFLVPNH